MRRVLVGLVFGLVVGSIVGLALPFEPEIYVDSAPNVYGSPDWDPWWTDTKDDVIAGGIASLRTGTFPRTSQIIPHDETVYSFGDLGKRLHWVYWIPGHSTTDLDGLFEVKYVLDYFGTDWTDDGGWALDGPDVGWSQPSRWEDASGGTIGSFGFAWWGAYYTKTQEELEADYQLFWEAQTYVKGLIRWRHTLTSEWQYGEINLAMVPQHIYSLTVQYGLDPAEAELVADLVDEFGISAAAAVALLAEFGEFDVSAAVRAAAGNPNTLYAILEGYDFAGLPGGGDGAGGGGAAAGDTLTIGEELIHAFEILNPLTGEPETGLAISYTILNAESLEVVAWGCIGFDDDAGQYILNYETDDLLPGEYELYIGLGNGGGTQVIPFTVI